MPSLVHTALGAWFGAMAVLVGNISLSYTTNSLVPDWGVLAWTTAAAAASGAALGLLASLKRRTRP